MFIQDRNSPSNQVFCALTLGLFCDPNFKVFNSVVVFNSINVMDVFKRLKRAAKMLFHDVSMLKLRASLERPDNIAALSLDVPTNTVFCAAHRTTGFNALTRTHHNITVGLGTKRFTAVFAQFGYKGSISFSLVHAIFGTVSASSCVRGFAKKVYSAASAFFGNRGLPNNPGVSAVLTTWHKPSKGLLTQAVIVPKQPPHGYAVSF
jgi:hypothetical protein